jgi:hypothetical protein
VIKLSRFLRRHERELRWYREVFAEGFPGAQNQNMNLQALTMVVKLAESLISEGFDEVLVTRFFDELDEEPGWLPVKGEDVVRVVKAFGESIVYPEPYIWTTNPTPLIVVVEGQVYAELSSLYVRPIPPYHRVLIRLDDAELGRRFTDGLSLERLGDDDARLLQPPRPKMLNSFRRISHEEYLKLASLVNGYSAYMYRRTGYPLQMLRPYLLPYTAGVYLAGEFDGLRRLGGVVQMMGYITPYDPRFETVIDACTRTVEDVPARERRTALLNIQAYGERVGEGLYRIEKPEAMNALEHLHEEYKPLLKAVSLCGEGIYLWLWNEGERPRYVQAKTPSRLLPTMIAFSAFRLAPRYMEKRWGQGPNALIRLIRRPIRLGDKRVIYHVATEPREWKGGKTYLDIETGSGFALPEEYIP